MRKVPVEEWQKIADKVCWLQEQLFDLGRMLQQCPKSAFKYDYRKAMRHYSNMKVRLVHQCKKEHPDEYQNIFPDVE